MDLIRIRQERINLQKYSLNNICVEGGEGILSLSIMSERSETYVFIYGQTHFNGHSCLLGMSLVVFL